MVAFGLGILAGLSIAFLFKVNKGPASGNGKKSVVSVSKQKKVAEKVETIFQRKIDSLTVQTGIVNEKLKRTRMQLIETKTRYKQLQSKLSLSLDSIKNTSASLLDATDGCMELRGEVVHLIEVVNLKDSLYEEAVNILDQQVMRKDSIIILQKEKYISLKSLFENALSQQGILAGNNRQLTKQLKRQKFRQKLFSVGIILMSAITLKSLIPK